MCVLQVAWPLVAPRLSIPASGRTGRAQPGLGASGAVNAVVALSILAAPARTVLVYMILPVPAAVLGALFLGPAPHAPAAPRAAAGPCPTRRTGVRACVCVCMRK